jgi:adenine-specific DNA-methyltransferase
VQFSFGGSLTTPSKSITVSSKQLRNDPKWTRYPSNERASIQPKVRLGDLFAVKRGLATGSNEFFILTPERVSEFRIPREFLIPVLPSPRYMRDDVIEADAHGDPQVDRRLYLFHSKLPFEKIASRFKSVAAYLQRGSDQKINAGYLCAHREPWYAQEDRPAPPLLCTYMGRQDSGKLFRFILNKSNATATNVYLLMYPKPMVAELLRKRQVSIKAIWKSLTEIPTSSLIGEGRVYGGGLHKLEPRELANASADALLTAVPALQAAVTT